MMVQSIFQDYNMQLDYLDKIQVEQIIEQYVPDKIDPYTHNIPRQEMKRIVLDLIEDEVIPLNKKAITLVCKEWKTLLWTKLSILN